MLSVDKSRSTRERSIAAALEVVRAEGIGGLTTRAIARRSGLTQPAIYRHFAGKEELVREVLGEIRGAFYTGLERAAEGANPRSRLLGAMEAFREFAVAEPRMYDALFLQTGDDAPTPPPVSGGQGGNIFGFLVERVADCAHEGALRREGPVATAISLAGHAQGLVLLYRQGRFGSAERFAEFYRGSMEGLVEGLA